MGGTQPFLVGLAGDLQHLPAANLPKASRPFSFRFTKVGFKAVSSLRLTPQHPLFSKPSLQVYDEDSGLFVVAGHEGDDDFHHEFWKRVLHSLCDAGYVNE